MIPRKGKLRFCVFPRRKAAVFFGAERDHSAARAGTRDGRAFLSAAARRFPVLQTLFQKHFQRFSFSRREYVQQRNAAGTGVMVQEEIVESGNHQTLLARKGKYYELYMTRYAGFAT